MVRVAAIGLTFAALFGAGVITRQTDAQVETCEVDSNGVCEVESTARAAKIDKTCKALKGNQIDWECVFGPGALEEVYDRGGEMTSCKEGSKSEPCSRFVVPKKEERAEVKVMAGPEGFPFLKHQKYTFRYSFKPKEGMRVAKKFTHLGQLKGSKSRRMIKGDPIYSLTANNEGLNVRFSNLESIEDYVDGMEKHLKWNDVHGEWVHVKITTVFGESMEVELSGAVTGKAVWPKHLKPVAWHRDSEMVRMKIGLYHAKGKVHDQEVIYKNVSIEGPNGIIRSGSMVNSEPSEKENDRTDDNDNKGSYVAEVNGYTYKGCFRDARGDRLFRLESRSDDMTNKQCAKDCEGSKFFSTQYGRECWCGDSNTDYDKHGKKAVCNLACSGSDSGEICGGLWAMSVYQAAGKTKFDDSSSAPDGAKYLGCFNDDQVDRALTLSLDRHDDMTHKKCYDICSEKRGASYMGLQWGIECFCGSSKDDYDQYGKASSNCKTKCPGDDTKTSVCGGPLALSVFRI